jgi:tetratricopeptide (TPR) repeat protein
LALRNEEKADKKKIRKLYDKILAINPKNAQIQTYMAETYYEDKDFATAKKWIAKALINNPIDYSAYKLKAEIFLEEGELDSALQAISLAHIFNRNSLSVATRLKEIYKQKELTLYDNWGFDPQYELRIDTNKTIVITADGIWLTYAMYKAVWTHEPDYHYIKSKQEVSDYLFHSEMEAAVGTFLTYSAMRDSDKRQFPAMRAIEIALDNELLEEYVMYEILLVDHPTLASHLSPEFLQRLMRYLNIVRGVDCTKNE